MFNLECIKAWISSKFKKKEDDAEFVVVEEVIEKPAKKAKKRKSRKRR